MDEIQAMEDQNVCLSLEIRGRVRKRQATMYFHVVLSLKERDLGSTHTEIAGVVLEQKTPRNLFGE